VCGTYHDLTEERAISDIFLVTADKVCKAMHPSRNYVAAPRESRAWKFLTACKKVEALQMTPEGGCRDAYIWVNVDQHGQRILSARSAVACGANVNVSFALPENGSIHGKFLKALEGRKVRHQQEFIDANGFFAWGNTVNILSQEYRLVVVIKGKDKVSRISHQLPGLQQQMVGKDVPRYAKPAEDVRATKMTPAAFSRKPCDLKSKASGQSSQKPLDSRSRAATGDEMLSQKRKSAPTTSAGFPPPASASSVVHRDKRSKSDDKEAAEYLTGLSLKNRFGQSLQQWKKAPAFAAYASTSAAKRPRGSDAPEERDAQNPFKIAKKTRREASASSSAKDASEGVYASTTASSICEHNRKRSECKECGG